MTKGGNSELRSLRLPKTSPVASDGASFAAHPFRALNSKGGVRCEPRSQASSEVIIHDSRNGNEGGCHLAHGSHALGTRVVPATSANPFAKRFSLARRRPPNWHLRHRFLNETGVRFSYFVKRLTNPEKIPMPRPVFTGRLRDKHRCQPQLCL